MGTSGVIRHGLSPNNIEKKHYQVNNLRHNLTLKRIKTPKKILDRFDKYDQKNYRTKKKWLSDELKVLILAKGQERDLHLVNFINSLTYSLF